MNEGVVYVYKPQGATPLEALSLLKKRMPQYKNEALSYAGRLDPMAEGVLVVLVGETNKRRRMFESKRKTYKVDILLGFETDTYDGLGMLLSPLCSTAFKKKEIEKATLSYQGKFVQEFPPYSSKTVNGKALFYWARENRLKEIIMPKRNVEIFNLKIKSLKLISAPALLKKIVGQIKKVNGDFRQDKIVEAWITALGGSKEKFQVVTLIAECSSGTYMRSLAHNIGKKLSSHGIALYIKREKVGNIGIGDCIHL